jgi:hypothetical protein
MEKIMEQIGIAVFGVLAVWFTQDRRFSIRRWACICGLAGQPFWMWTAIKHHQWGIVLLVFLYGASWARGLWTYWFRKEGRDAKP